jgi:hypothetical protein
MGLAERTSRAVQGLATLATSVTAAIPNIDPTPSSLVIDPGEKARGVTNQLLDVRIPDSLKTWLMGPLASLAFSIDHVEVQRFTEKRFYTLIKNSVGQISMFHVPKDILESAGGVETLDAVISALRIKKQTLIVVSENCEKVHLDFAVLGAPTWLEDGVQWEFVPWEYLELAKTKTDDQKRVYLPRLFHLEGLLKEAQKLPVHKITETEVSTLVNIVSQIPQFIDNSEQAWRLTLAQAGLNELITSLKFDGASKDVSFSVINQLRYYAPLNDFPQDQVLGRFLCQILLIQGLKTADIVIIQGIVKTYNLAPSFVKD